MKAQRLVTIDYELNVNLSKEDNASGLVNSLLIKYYNDNKSEEQIIQDVKDLIKEKKDKEDNYNKYNNPKHITKRIEEMQKAKIERDNIKTKEQKERERRNAK